ncbi:MAG: CDP-alcohol phosphatidyltransferase family protein [Christensenellaceae bacterium]
MKENKETIFNLPNLLALLRLLLVPVVVGLILSDKMVAALSVFLTACLTDILDGFIARKYGLITKLGTWLDPLADKLMAISVIVCFTYKGILPLFVMIIIFTKEMLMLLGGLIAVQKGAATPANIFGKIASFVLNVAIASGFLYQYLSPYYLWVTYGALVCSIIAFVQYAVKNKSLIFDKKGEEKE